MAQKLLGNLDKGLFFVVSAPAGSGKTTLVSMLTKEFDCVIRSISYTTREKRAGEFEGRDYFFISEKEFLKKIKKNEFLEYANVFDAYYGTSKEFVEKNINQKKHVVLVIDTQGAAQLKQSDIGIHIFISPPSEAVLKDRLIKRNTESLEEIEKRLSWYHKEMGQKKYYDYEIINDKLEISYQILRSIIIAEEHRTNKKR